MEPFMNNSFIKSSLVSLALIVSPAAFAQDIGAYVTGGFGYGTVEESSRRGDDGRLTGKLGLGYQFTQNLALEGMFQYYFTNSSNYYYDTSAYVGALLGVLRAPVTDQLFIIGKVGPGYTRIQRDFQGYFDETFNEDGFSISYGVGLEFAFTPSFSVVGEYLGTTTFISNYDWFGNDYNQQLNSIMGSVLFRF